MKKIKILLSVVAILIAIVMVPRVKAKKIIPVYMFSKEGCPACEDAKDYFNEINKENPDLFKLVELTVLDANYNVIDEDLKDLLIKVYEEFDEDTSKIVTPTIVLGSYHTIGLPTDNDEVLNEIKKAKDDKKYVDKVKEIAKEINVDMDKYNKEENENSGKYDVIIIIGIFVVLIGGAVILFISSKK